MVMTGDMSISADMAISAGGISSDYHRSGGILYQAIPSIRQKLFNDFQEVPTKVIVPVVVKFCSS